MGHLDVLNICYGVKIGHLDVNGNRARVWNFPLRVATEILSLQARIY